MIKISKFACVLIFKDKEWCFANNISTRIRLAVMSGEGLAEELEYIMQMKKLANIIDPIICATYSFGYFCKDEWLGEVFHWHRVAAPAAFCNFNNEKYFYLNDTEFYSKELYLEKLNKDQKLLCILSEEFLNDWTIK